MLRIEEYAKKSQTLLKEVNQLLIKTGVSVNLIEKDNSENITLVFAGQYSAGKSSIIKMLTGNEDIKIGSGITTQATHTYNWNGIKVIDTPGINSDLRPDHDAISYDAIAQADMLVFVVTNELFDSYMAQHFRKLAIEKDKAGEMILVVNKMKREDEGNTPAKQQIKRNNLIEVLEPYTPEQLNVCFLDAESYLSSISERALDPEYADELVEDSGYEKFVETLNSFVIERGIIGKLTTLLYKIEETIQKVLSDLDPNHDEDIKALIEQLSQQKQEYVESRYQIKHTVKALFISAAAEIREVGLKVAYDITDAKSEEEAEEILEKASKSVDSIAERCQQEAQDNVMELLKKLSKSIEELEESDLSNNLKLRLSKRFETLPSKVQSVLKKAGDGIANAGKNITKGTYKAGVNGGMKLSNFSGSTIHDTVLKVGHFFGHKFKPWEAVKWTKGVSIAGRALSVFGIVFSIGMQIKSDFSEEQQSEEMKDNRQKIRSSFNSAAKELENYSQRFIENVISQSLDSPISELNKNISEIRSTCESRTQDYRQLETLQDKCVSLIKEIHSENFVY